MRFNLGAPVNYTPNTPDNCATAIIIIIIILNSYIYYKLITIYTVR